MHCCGHHPTFYATSTMDSCLRVKRPRRESILVLRLTPSWPGHTTLFCLRTRRHAPEVSNPHAHHPKISNLTRIISSVCRRAPCVLFFAEVIWNNHIWKQIRLGISWGWLHSERFVWGCVGGWNRGGGDRESRILEKSTRGSAETGELVRLH